MYSTTKTASNTRVPLPPHACILHYRHVLLFASHRANLSLLLCSHSPPTVCWTTLILLPLCAPERLTFSYHRVHHTTPSPAAGRTLRVVAWMAKAVAALCANGHSGDGNAPGQGWRRCCMWRICFNTGRRSIRTAVAVQRLPPGQ
jgi:hypothetical protein